MCFSANASFGASIVLGAIGVVSLTRVKKSAQTPFAIIPIMFAVQQLAEGMLWISLSDPGHGDWRRIPIYIFLAFAQIIWPVWVPFSVLLLEEERFRRRLLTFFLIIGLFTSSYLLYCLFVYEVSAELQAGHIHYTLDFPISFAGVISVLYFIPTVISLFVSSVKRMPELGVAILISFILTRIFFEDYLISVWCFFAAVLSLIVVGITLEFSKDRPIADLGAKSS